MEMNICCVEETRWKTEQLSLQVSELQELKRDLLFDPEPPDRQKDNSDMKAATRAWEVEVWKGDVTCLYRQFVHNSVNISSRHLFRLFFILHKTIHAGQVEDLPSRS